jgi:hypothetical protein
VIAQVARAYRAHWRTLLLAGLVVFAPIGVLEVLGERLGEPLAEGEADDFDAGAVVAIVAGLVGLGLGSLIGEVVYTGIVAALMHGHERGDEVSVRDVLRHLPLGRLVCIDLLFFALVVAGLIALIVPGVLFLTWFALIAPAAEIEDRGVRDSFRRSRELVRRRFWLVFGFVVGLLAAEEGLAGAASSISVWGAGEGAVGEWLASVFTGLLVSPLAAVVAVVLFLGLRRSDAA